MSAAAESANKIMRKASEAFAKGKMQKAHRTYGQALRAYETLADTPWDRVALALYTRVLLVLGGDATGDVTPDLDRGDEITAHREFVDSRRFGALFRLARARWRRQHEDLESARRHLDDARLELNDHGRTFDLFELEQETLRLAMDEEAWDLAEAAGHRALDHCNGPKQVIHVRILRSEVFRAQKRMKDVLLCLEKAASLAYDKELKDQLWDLQDRIRILKRNHPELNAN